jgi:hypothetical protein
MKHSKLILTLASLAILSSGCAKEFKSTENQTVATGTPGVVNPTFPTSAPPGEGAGTAGDNWGYGGTGDFTPDMNMMRAYVGHYIDTPTNMKINVNVIDVGDGRFGGQVKLAYDSAGVHHEGYFVAGTGRNQYFPNNNTNTFIGWYQAEFNRWLNGTIFSGYFQDSLGAVVLVIDDIGPNLGDGQGSTTVTGSLWFRNFPPTYAVQGPMSYCWYITAGPYQCMSPNVNAKVTPYPSDTYQKLGTFTGLSRAKAFNQ